MNNNNAQNVNITNMNASNTPGFKYSQTAGVLDAAQAMAQGKKAGKEWAKAFADELSKELKKELKDFSGIKKPMNELKSNFETMASDIAVKFGTGKGGAFSGEALKTYTSFVKDLDKVIADTVKTTKAIETETAKAQPNAQTLVKLAEDKAKAEEAANKATATALLTLQKIELEEQQQAAKKAMYNKTDADARAKAKRDYEDITSKLLDVSEQIEEINATLEEGSKKLGDNVDKLNTKITNFLTGFKDGIGGLSDAIKTASTAINSFFDVTSFDKQIQMWDREIDRYTKARIEINNSFGNLSTFDSYKNSIIQNQPKGLYNSEQLMDIMKDMSSYSFKNTEIAEKMSKDLAFAKEYMGVSNENLHGLYELQVRTGQDDFVRKSLNNITALQKSGIAISQDQLNHEIESSKTLTDRLIDMGMGYEEATKVMSQFTALQANADAIYGQGAGDLIIKTIEKSLSPDEIGLMSNNPSSTINKVRNGNVAGFVEDIFINSPISKAANQIDMSNPLNALIASENGGFINGTDNAMRRIGGDEDKFSELTTAINNYTDNTDNATDSTKSLDETVQEIIDTLPDKLKEGNAKSEELMLVNWKTMSDQIALQKDIETKVQRTNQLLDFATSTLTIAIAVMSSLTSSVNANTAAQSANALGGLTGGVDKVGGLKGVFKTLNGTNGTKLGTAIGKINSNPMVKGVAVLGGLKAGYDMFQDGSTGLKDSSGNVVGTSGWDRAAAVFGGSNMVDYESGSNLASSGLNGLGKGAAIGAAIGSFVPVLGTVMGGVIGGAVGGIAGLISGGHKDRKAAELAQKRRDEELLAIEKASKDNLTALKNQRDVALSNRYSDSRFGIGAPEPVQAAPYIAPAKNEDLSKPHGGTYEGVDCDGFTRTASFPYYSSGGRHYGMDFTKAHNTPIGAAFDGEVINIKTDGKARWDNDTTSQGNFVQVYHKDRDVTATYYHLNSIAPGVQKGVQLKAGDTLGFQGNTGHCIPHPGKNYNDKGEVVAVHGATAGSHLHYEVHPGKTGAMGSGAVSPANYLTPQIFYASGEAPTLTQGYNDNDSGTGTKNQGYNASVVRASTIPTVNGGPTGGPSNNTVNATDFKSSSLEEKLDTINNTLLNMTERQDKQQRILDALSVKPIHNFGV